MERTIGNLGEEIRQPSQPFANLAERGARRAQVNALIALVPDLAPPKPPSHLSHNLNGGYILSMADTRSRPVSEIEKQVIRKFFQSSQVQIQITVDFYVQKWGRLQLPNLQFVRTAWKETAKPLDKVRMARNVMVSGHNLVLNLKATLVSYPLFRSSTKTQTKTDQVLLKFNIFSKSN